MIRAIKKFTVFSYSEETNIDKLWINTNLLSGISGDINNHQTNPQQIVRNYDVIKNFLINVETNHNTSISDKCNVRIREVSGKTFVFHREKNSFDGNFDRFYVDKKRTFGVN